MRLVLISIVLATLIGCTSVRLPLVYTTYDVGDLKQATTDSQSASSGKNSNTAGGNQQWMQHWEAAAESEATEITDKLRLDKTPLHLVTEDPESSENPFLAAYTNFLAQHLLAKDNALITDPRLAKANDAADLRSNLVVTRHNNATEEVAMITTTVHHGGQMIFSNSTVYYLYPPDAAIYKAKQKVEIQKKNLAVVECPSGTTCS